MTNPPQTESGPRKHTRTASTTDRRNVLTVAAINDELTTIGNLSVAVSHTLAAQIDAEERLFRLLRDYRDAGLLDITGLRAVYVELRPASAAGMHRRWCEAGLPSIHAMNRHARRRADLAAVTP